MTSIEFIRNRLRCAKRRERHHRGPWAGDKGGRHSERHSLAKDDVASLTAQLQAMISNAQHHAEAGRPIA